MYLYNFIKKNQVLGVTPHIEITKYPEVNSALSEKFPDNANYFNIPAFSVCTNVSYNSEMYSVGYYFSLIHTFVATLEQDIDIQDFVEKLDILGNESGKYILTDRFGRNNVAFVDRERQLFMQLFSHEFIKKYFKSPTIIPILNNTTLNNFKFIGNTKTFGTKIYSNSELFNHNNINDFIDRNVLPEFTNSYSIIDKGSYDVDYCYFSDIKTITLVYKTDPILKLLFKSPKIVKNKSTKFSNYIMNDPIYNRAQLWANNSITA